MPAIDIRPVRPFDVVGLIDGLCTPANGVVVLNDLASGNFDKATAGALSITTDLRKWLEGNTDLVKRLGAGALVANLLADGAQAYDDIKETGQIRSSTVLNLLADASMAVALAVPAISVPMAIAGLAYSVLSWIESNKEKEYENFKKFASYLNSNEAQEYMTCPNCLNIDISNPKVYENDGIANFTITLSKPLKEKIRLRLFTVQGSATHDKDYSGIKQSKPIFVEIPAGTTEYEQSISIVRDGKYEGQEDFLLVVDDIHYTGADVSHIINKDGVAVGLGTIIDIEQDKCPKPVTPNFSLNFPLPSAPSYYTPTYGGGGSGGGSSGGSSGGGGSSGSTYTPTPTPLPNVPYIPCYDTPEKHSALVMKVNTSANSNENSDNATYETREANNLNSNPTRHSEQSEESLNFNSNNANSIDTENSENSNNETTTQPNKIYFDYNNDGFKENMLTWFSKDEAVLVNDINNNGFVDNGSEILGNNYTNKFGNKVIDILSLLDEFDTNNDGVINNKDNTNLALWQDKNQNGKTDENELIKFANLNLLVA